MQQPSFNGGLAPQNQPNINGMYPNNNTQANNGYNNNINNNSNGSIAVNAGPTNPYANINNYNNNNNNYPRNGPIKSGNQNIDYNSNQMKNNLKSAPGYNATPQGTPPLPSELAGYTNKYKNRVQIMSIVTHITLIILFFSQMIQTGVFIGSYNDIVDSNYSVSDKEKQFNQCRDGLLGISVFIVLCSSASFIINVIRPPGPGLRNGILGFGAFLLFIFFILGILFLCIQPDVIDMYDEKVLQVDKLTSQD